MPRILVTGASGFVGRHLAEGLRDRAEVVAAVRDSTQLPPSLHNLERLPFDLEQADRLNPSALQGFDCIYHLAARVHVMSPSASDEHRFHSLNVRATELLASAAAQAGVRRFIYVSSIKVNGERTVSNPFTASDAPAPEDAYARSKLDAERVLFGISSRSGMEVIVVRPPLIYGPGVGANFRRLIALVDSGWPLPFGAVDNRRSLVSVWNLASLLGDLLANEQAPGKVWLISDGMDVATSRLLELIGAGLGRRTRLVSVPIRMLTLVGRLAGRSAEMSRLTESLCIDMSDTQMQLGWRPSMSLEEGIARTTRWFKETCRASR